jgi:predicted ATP-dependent serine protease
MTELSKNAETLKDMLAQVLANAQNDIDSQVFEKTKKTDQLIIKPSIDNKTLKTLVAIKTGTFLDSMFLDDDEKSIDGIPFGSSIIIGGIPNTGKSLLFSELALRLANNGYKIAFIISEEVWKTETARLDLESRMKGKASILKLDWLKISENLFVLDCVSHAELRQFENLVSSYKSLVEDKGVTITITDSLSLIEDSRGQIKNRLLEFVRYGQTKGVTSLFISQRATDDVDGFSLAGGLSLTHIVDIMAVMDSKKLSSWDKNIKEDTGKAQGESINFFHILKNRLCKYRANYFGYTIDQNGIVKLDHKT